MWDQLHVGNGFSLVWMSFHLRLWLGYNRLYVRETEKSQYLGTFTGRHRKIEWREKSNTYDLYRFLFTHLNIYDIFIVLQQFRSRILIQRIVEVVHRIL
jgi:hypothetical protein